jgi:hypothetical protein
MLQFFAALIAAATVSIAFFQWRTAQQKVVIDVFEERYKIYQQLRTAVSEYLQTLVFQLEAQRNFFEAMSRARFYFGAEVDTYLKSIQSDINTAQLFDRYAQRPNPNIDEQIDRLNRLNAFYTEIDRMFVPYMRIDQNMPLWWWSALKLRATAPLSRRN